jgi:hypothetical protein
MFVNLKMKTLIFTLIVIIYWLALAIYGIYSDNNFFEKTEILNNYFYFCIIYIIVKIIIFIMYVYCVTKNNRIKQIEQILWILVFIFIGNIMMLVYWFIYINRNNAKVGHCT